MTCQKVSLNLKAVLVAICLGITTIPNISPVQAKPLSFRPPNVGAPSTTAGGGSRSSCVKSEQPLTALMPKDSLPLTIAANPTFFVYVPKTDAKMAEFVLRDENDDDIYRTSMPVPQSSGIVRLKLPANTNANANALQVGKDYRWYFALICKPDDRREDIFVDGWIQRVKPAAELANADRLSAQELPSIYANAGIWYEALNSLAELRRTNPNDPQLMANWTELLNSVGLESFVRQPIVK